MMVRACRPSKPAEQHQDQKNNEHRAETARGVIAPARAVWPSRQSADQKYDHDNQENQPHPRLLGFARVPTRLWFRLPAKTRPLRQTLLSRRAYGMGL